MGWVHWLRRRRRRQRRHDAIRRHCLERLALHSLTYSLRTFDVPAHLHGCHQPPPPATTIARNHRPSVVQFLSFTRALARSLPSVLPTSSHTHTHTWSAPFHCFAAVAAAVLRHLHPGCKLVALAQSSSSRRSWSLAASSLRTRACASECVCVYIL